MIEDNIEIVKSIQTKSGRSGTYWRVTWQDETTDNIFNGDWLPLLEQSQKGNHPLHFTKEKTEDSKYYNFKSLELAQETEDENQTAPKLSIEMNREDRREKGMQEEMFWKELGEMLRSGDIDKAKPTGKALRKLYYAKMFSVLEIKLKLEEEK